MSTPIPAKLPRWADNGGAIVEPSEGKKDIGWLGNPPDQPPAQYFNWLFNLIYQWAAVVSAMVGSIKRHTTTFLPTANGTWQWSSANARPTVTALTTGNAEAAFPLVLAEGEKLTAVSVKANKAASGGGHTMTVTVNLNAAGTPSSLGTANSTASGAVTITPSVTPHTVASGDMITVDINTNDVNDAVIVIEYTVDRSGGF